MSNSYDSEFKGTRAVALSAKDKIQQKMQSYASSKHQLQYSLIVLRSMAVAVGTPEGKHYDIYCDIFEQILAPNIVPESSPPNWSRCLDMLKYLQNLYLQKCLYKESASIVSYLSATKGKLQSEDDYKFVLYIYCQHLLGQRINMNNNEIAAKTEMDRALMSLTALFKDMLNANYELNFQYHNLISEFIRNFFYKQTNGVYQFISALPPCKSQMYESFFILLGSLRTTQPTQNELSSIAQAHIEANAAMLHFDIVDKLQDQLALRHMRICGCEMTIFRADKAISFTLSLLYYSIKISYLSTKLTNFTSHFTELCRKLKTLYDKNGNVLAQHKWFTEATVLLVSLLQYLQKHAQNFFSDFWLQIHNKNNCYESFLELLLVVIKFMPKIQDTNLLQMNCCSDFRNHIIINFTQIGLTLYSDYLNGSDQTEKCQFDELLAKILFKGVSSIGELPCITTESQCLKMLCAGISHLTRQVKTEISAVYSVVALGGIFGSLRIKCSETDWSFVLRRLYKTAQLINDQKLFEDIQCCYIASMLLEKMPPRNKFYEFSAVRNQLCIYYFPTASEQPTKSISEIYEGITNNFKPCLEAHHKQMLLRLEIHYFTRYIPGSTSIKESLKRLCKENYYMTLILRAGKTETEDYNMLRDICAKLVNSKKRLDHLTLAIAYSLLLQSRLDTQKCSFNVDTNCCTEDKLHELMQRKEFIEVNATNEANFLTLALNTFNEFKKFFDKIDEEYIPSTEVHIEWDFLLNDLATVALCFQLFGYLEYSTEAWLLHYRISNMLQDSQNSLRALSYFCEHHELVEHFISLKDNSFNLEHEIKSKYSAIIFSLENLETLARNQQSDAMNCVNQLAYYYSCKGQQDKADIYLSLVELKHKTLPKRKGLFDVVLLVQNMVRFRIKWKHTNALKLEDIPLLHYVDLTLVKFRDFTAISSHDSLPYMICLYNFLYELAECLANRLCEPMLGGLFASVLKVALQTGSALRIVQTLTMWLWINLNMEDLKKIDAKFLMIDLVLGIKNQQELLKLQEICEPIKKPAANLEAAAYESEMMLENLNLGMQAVRRVAQTHDFSPGKMEISRIDRINRDLTNFIYPRNHDIELQNEWMQWYYFAAGCMKARYFFLSEDYEPLERFYEAADIWWTERKNNSIVCLHLRNIRLMCIQHYANFLRLNKKHQKAKTCLESALQKCCTWNSKVDPEFRANFTLQLQEVQKEELSKNGCTRLKTASNCALKLNFNEVVETQHPTTSTTNATTSVIQPSSSTMSNSTNQRPKKVASSESVQNMLNNNIELLDSVEISDDEGDNSQEGMVTVIENVKKQPKPKKTLTLAELAADIKERQLKYQRLKKINEEVFRRKKTVQNDVNENPKVVGSSDTDQPALNDRIKLLDLVEISDDESNSSEEEMVTVIENVKKKSSLAELAAEIKERQLKYHRLKKILEEAAKNKKPVQKNANTCRKQVLTSGSDQNALYDRIEVLDSVDISDNEMDSSKEEMVTVIENVKRQPELKKMSTLAELAADMKQRQLKYQRLKKINERTAEMNKPPQNDVESVTQQLESLEINDCIAEPVSSADTANTAAPEAVVEKPKKRVRRYKIAVPQGVDAVIVVETADENGVPVKETVTTKKILKTKAKNAATSNQETSTGKSRPTPKSTSTEAAAETSEKNVVNSKAAKNTTATQENVRVVQTRATRIAANEVARRRRENNENINNENIQEVNVAATVKTRSNNDVSNNSNNNTEKKSASGRRIQRN